MGFETLLGNERLKENLRRSVGRGRLSHFYLLSGPQGAGKQTLARLLSAAAVCRGEDKPCCACSACRKALSGNHPDIITVTDPDHKNVAVRLVREARADMYIRPNESEHKVYLFPQALGIEGQNALLKILEEPPGYGVFILLSDNPEALLPTVRSRCTELKLLPLSAPLLQSCLTREFPEADPADIAAAITRSAGFLGQARALLASGNALSPQTGRFAAAFSGRDVLELTLLTQSMEKWKRDQAIAEWQCWLQLLQAALSHRAGQPTPLAPARELAAARSGSELLQGAQILQKIIEYAQGNVSVAAVCGYLQYALR